MRRRAWLLGSAGVLTIHCGYTPWSVDHVKVCDAFGVGYHYLPGTDTCLAIFGTQFIPFALDAR